MIDSILHPNDLPLREGSLPRVYPGPPQHQLDQLPSGEEWLAMRKTFDAWESAERAPSRRAVPGTLGLHVGADEKKSASPEAFMIGNEFAHHHPQSDGGLHLVLPPAWHAAAIEKRWAIPHTLAGEPTVSRQIVLVFAPRNALEREVIRRLVEEAERFARGGD